MRLISLVAASVAAAVLAGCAGVSNESVVNQRQLDATTYEVEVMQAWVKDETIMREEARRQATNFCLETQRGMQPVQIFSRSATETGKGAMARLTYRRVVYMEAPKREYQPLIIKTPTLTDDEDLDEVYNNK